MRTPEIVSITVVEKDGRKKFRLPNSSLEFNILAGLYGSYKPYDEAHERIYNDHEVDTPFVMFRNGEYYDHGQCKYLFGSDGYHVVAGLARIDKGSDHLAFIEARWFESGDVIAFVRTPSAYELQQRKLTLEGRQ